MHLLRVIVKILLPKEVRKLWQLALADLVISILDIIFLFALLFVINFYTQSGSPSRYFSPVLLEEHPLLFISFFLILFTLKNIAGFYISKSQFDYAYCVASRISGDRLMHYLNGPYTEYVHTDSSVMNRKISQQPIEFCHYVLNGLQQIFSQLALILITLAAVISFNPFLLPLLILILVPPVFMVSFFIRRKLREGRLNGKKMSEKSIQHLQEALTGFVESNVHLKNDFFTNRYKRTQSRLNHFLSERLTIQNMPTRFIEVFAVFGLFLLIVLSYTSSHHHSVPLMTLGTLMVAAYKIIPGIVKITNLSGQVRTYAYTVKGLIEKEKPPAKVMDILPGVFSVHFENVYFDFGGKAVLHSFSMNLEKGDMAGISGISGRGKTTLVNLLLGFLSTDRGNIYINHRKTDAVSRKKYWRGISYIKQQHFFLHGSIAENISFEEGHYDKIKMDEVLTLTGVGDMIAHFPEGLDTVVTENGKNFSGGQRQRLILARALYRNFDLLILDEPFNELDHTAEMELLKELRILADKGKIILLITHNADAFSICNKKIFLHGQEV